MDVLELDTPRGLARAHVDRAPDAVGALALGHGAGGGIRAGDLVTVAELARSLGLSVALIEQPYRVAGRRSPVPAGQLDEAWLTVIDRLREGPLRDLAIVAGGRSSGARVACRTAASAGCIGVLCLAFPLHPPGHAEDPSKSRLAELDAVRVPVLVVQGERDPFGMPGEGDQRTVVRVPGDHSLKSTAAVRAAVAAWLPQLFPAD